VVDSTFCPRCSAPSVPGESSCANCGMPLSGATVGEAQPGVPRQTLTEAVDQQGTEPDAPPVGLRGAVTADPRLAKLGLGVTAPASVDQSGGSRPHDPVAPPVHMPGNWQLDLRSMAERPAALEPLEPEPEPEPDGGATGHIPGGYLAPSATYRGSGSPPPLRDQAPPSDRSAGPSLGASIGAVPIPPAGTVSPLGAASQVLAPAPAILASPVQATAVASTPKPSGLPAPERPVTSTATQPARKESAQELVAFGLVAAGGVVGFASLFLPWAGSTGIGIGTVASAGAPPQSNQWAWGMPAAIPLLVLTALLLGAAAGSDRAQQQLPALASVIARVTDVILPMVLAGLYFGVGLLYVTLPPQFGFGTGIIVLIGGGCLLLAGSIVGLFLTPGDDPVTR
jgi:hypothetical protein